MGFPDRGRDHREKVKEKEIPLKDQTGFKGEEGEKEGGEGEGEVEDKGKRPPKTDTSNGNLFGNQSGTVPRNQNSLFFYYSSFFSRPKQ